MKKRGLIIFLSALLFSGQTCADHEAVKYDESLKKWRAESIDSYHVKVQYRAFSPLQGEWELEVEKGRVVEAKFNGTGNAEYTAKAERFTVDSLFKTAEGAGNCDEKSPMCTTVEFSRTIPYIKSVKRMNNRSFNGKVMKDAGYSIVVVEFRRG